MEALKEIGAQSPFLPSVRCKEEANALSFSLYHTGGAHEQPSFFFLFSLAHFNDFLLFT
jgi:hypothetical protein